MCRCSFKQSRPRPTCGDTALHVHVHPPLHTCPRTQQGPLKPLANKSSGASARAAMYGTHVSSGAALRGSELVQGGKACGRLLQRRRCMAQRRRARRVGHVHVPPPSSMRFHGMMTLPPWTLPPRYPFHTPLLLHPKTHARQDSMPHLAPLALRPPLASTAPPCLPAAPFPLSCRLWGGQGHPSARSPPGACPTRQRRRHTALPSRSARSDKRRTLSY